MVKALATKPNGLNLIPRTMWREEKTNSRLHTRDVAWRHTDIYIHTYIIINVFLKFIIHVHLLFFMYCFYLKSSIWNIILHIIQFTILKFVVSWFSVSGVMYTHHHGQFQITSSPQRQTQFPLTTTPILPWTPSALSNYWSFCAYTFASTGYFIKVKSYIWYVMTGFFHFTQCFQSLSCYIMYNASFLFSGQIVFLCMDISHLFIHSSFDVCLDCLYFLNIWTRTFMDIYVYVFVWIPIFFIFNFYLFILR